MHTAHFKGFSPAFICFQNLTHSCGHTAVWDYPHRQSGLGDKENGCSCPEHEHMSEHSCVLSDEALCLWPRTPMPSVCTCRVVIGCLLTRKQVKFQCLHGCREAYLLIEFYIQNTIKFNCLYLHLIYWTKSVDLLNGSIALVLSEQCSGITGAMKMLHESSAPAARKQWKCCTKVVL